MKKILIVLIVAIPVIFWGIWIAVPETSIQSIIEDSISNDKLRLEVKGLKKGLLYTLSIDNVILKSSHQEMISLDNIHGYINPLSLITLRLNISMDGSIGSGNISGNINLTKNKMQTSLNFNKANINAIPMFKIIGIQGTGTVSGRIIVKDD
ncbi:MAG: type II secretion system protein GspN, partial [Nitrospirota bacterium]|nr:type II secretion system protein GspN [Nitrospirota bacterium]